MATIRINVEGKQAEQTLARLNKDFKGLDASIEKTTKTNKKMTSSLASMAKGLIATYAAAITLRGAFNFGSSFVKTAAEFEQFETTLTAISGSSVRAKESMKWIQDFASTTPYELAKVTESFVKMKAYGLDPMDGTLKALGNASSAMGKDIVQAVEAMADAVTGENERLKEFGIKAAKVGEDIQYRWSDSSGKTREVVIDNNKEIIQSTLNAIFNEKYAGAMDMQAKTWNGMISNMQDNWTIFKKEVMSEGLFTYLKGMLGVAGEMFAEMFGEGREAAKTWSEGTIGGIKSVILGIGDMVDMWTGITTTFSAVKVAFFGLVYGIGEGINKLGEGFEAFRVGINNAFKGVFDAIGKGFHKVLEFLIEGINKFIEGSNNLLGDFSPFAGVSLSLKEYKSSIDTAVMSTEKLVNTDWSNSMLNESIAEVKAGVDSMINEDGAKKAEEAIGRIDAMIKTQVVDEKKIAAEKAKNGKLLDAHLAKYGKIGKEIAKNAKGTGAATKAVKDQASEVGKLANAVKSIGLGDDTLDLFGNIGKDAEKFADDLADQMADLGDDIANGLDGAFDIFLTGDLEGAFQSMFRSLQTEFTNYISSAIVESQTFGTILAALGIAQQAQGEAYSAWARMAAMAATMAGLGLFAGSIGGGGGISEQEMKEAEGITGVQSTAVDDSIDLIAENSTIGLEYSSQMASSLDKLVNLTNSAAARIGSGLTGEDYVAKNKDGIWGGRTEELISTGVWLESATIDELNAGTMKGSEYMTEKIVKSSWWGLKKKESLSTQIAGDADTAFMDSVNAAYLEGIDTLRSASEALGMSAGEFDAISASWETSIAKLNFAGKDQQEIAEMINGVISADLDRWGGTLAQVAGYVDQFALAGETTATTIVRLANDYEVVGRSLRGIGQILPAVGQGGLVATEALIKASGGLDQFQSAMSMFMNTFYSDSERLAIQTQNLSIAFQLVGLQLPASKAAMKVMYEEVLFKFQKATIEAELLKKQAAIAEAEVAIQVALMGVGSQAAITAANAAAIAADKANQAADLVNELGAQVEMLTLNMGDITAVFGDASYDIEGVGDSMDTASGAAAGMASSVGGLSDAMTDYTQQHVDANFNALAMVDTIYGELMTTIQAFSGAMDDLFGKLETRTMSLNEALELTGGATLENYQDILSQLDASRLQEEGDVKAWNKAMLDTLKDQKKFFEDMEKSLEKIRDGITKLHDLAKGENEQYNAMAFFNMKEEIERRVANNESISDISGDYTSAGLSYAKAMRSGAGTSEEAEFETLRIAAMMEESLQGAETAATLDSIEAQIEITNDILELQLMRIQEKYEEGVLEIMETLNDEFDAWIDETATFYAQYLGEDSELVVGILSLHNRASVQWTQEQEQNIADRNAEDAAWSLFAYNQVLDRNAMAFGLDTLDLALGYDGAIQTTLEENLGIYLPRLMTVNADEAILSSVLLARENRATMWTIVTASNALNEELSANERSVAWLISGRSHDDAWTIAGNARASAIEAGTYTGVYARDARADALLERQSLESIYTKSKIYAESYAARTDAVSWAIDAQAEIDGDGWSLRNHNDIWNTAGRANTLQKEMKTLAVGANGYSEVMRDYLSTISWRAQAKDLRNMSNEDRIRLEAAFKNAREGTAANKSAQQRAYDQVEWANKFMVDKCTFTTTINALKTSNWTGLSAVNSSIRGINTGGTDSGVQSAVYSAGHTAANATYNIGNQISTAIYNTRSSSVPMASGGIVMKPTNAIVAEAGYPEAVIPLKDPNDPLGMKDTNKLLKSMDKRLAEIEASNEKIKMISKRQAVVSEESIYLMEERL